MLPFLLFFQFQLLAQVELVQLLTLCYGNRVKVNFEPELKVVIDTKKNSIFCQTVLRENFNIGNEGLFRFTPVKIMHFHEHENLRKIDLNAREIPCLQVCQSKDLCYFFLKKGLKVKTIDSRSIVVGEGMIAFIWQVL